MKGIKAQGTVYSISDGGSPTSFSAVGNLTDFNLSGSAPEIDGTNLDSVAAELVGAGVPKYKFTGTINIDPDNTTHQALRNALANGTRLEHKVVLASGTLKTCQFFGYVVDFGGPAAAVNGKSVVNVTVAIDGAWNWV